MAGEGDRVLDGRVVIVAGADTEPGAGMARSVADAGATVVVCGSSAAALGTLAAELGAAGARAAVFAGDPSRDADRAALAEMVAELFDPR